jgi:hypothetical protein
MVGATGIEPVTTAMSTQRPYVKMAGTLGIFWEFLGLRAGTARERIETCRQVSVKWPEVVDRCVPDLLC